MIARGGDVGSHRVEALRGRLAGAEDPAALDPGLAALGEERVGHEQVVDLVVLARDRVVAMRPAIGSLGNLMETGPSHARE